MPILLKLSSIRFELIREGMEDYELLRQSAPADAKTAIQSFISAADTFAADPAKRMAARETLGDRLHLAAINK